MVVMCRSCAPCCVVLRGVILSLWTEKYDTRHGSSPIPMSSELIHCTHVEDDQLFKYETDDEPSQDLRWRSYSARLLGATHGD